MENTANSQTTDFVNVTIIRSHNFTAKAIHLGMWLWCVGRGLKPEKTYNHTEIGYDGLTSGAIAEGVKTRNWSKYWSKFKNAERIHYEIPLTKIQWEKGKKYLDKAEDTPYEFENFWWHLVKIITGKWKGSKTSRKTYCYEHSIRFLNATGKFKLNAFLNPYEFKKIFDKYNFNQF